MLVNAIQTTCVVRIAFPATIRASVCMYFPCNESRWAPSALFEINQIKWSFYYLLGMLIRTITIPTAILLSFSFSSGCHVFFMTTPACKRSSLRPLPGRPSIFRSVSRLSMLCRILLATLLWTIYTFRCTNKPFTTMSTRLCDTHRCIIRSRRRCSDFHGNTSWSSAAHRWRCRLNWHKADNQDRLHIGIYSTISSSCEKGRTTFIGV